MSVFKEGRYFYSRRRASAAAATDAYPQLSTERTEHFKTPTIASTLFAFASIEFLTVSMAALLAQTTFASRASMNSNMPGLHYAIPIAVGALHTLASTTFDNFRYLQSASRHRFLASGIVSLSFAFLLITFGLYVAGLSATYSRDLLGVQFLAACLAMLATRAAINSWFARRAADGTVRGRRIVLVGREKTFPGHAALLKSLRLSVQVLCCPIPPSNAPAGSISTAEHLAAALVEECRSLQADDVVLLADETRQDELKQISSTFREIPAAIYAIPTRHLHLGTNAHLVEIAGIPALGVSVPRLSGWNRTLKRLFDIVVATLALIALSPLLILTSAAIALDSRGSVFFWQIRHGYNNTTIRVLKFRTMHVSADKTFRQASRRDSRITRVGRILRITGIDELPQILNVLRGEMSIVGPRPHAVRHNEMFISRINHFSRRHNVLPGITGWAQVNGYRGETDTLEKMINRIDCDIYYVDNWSLWLDLKIIFLTVFSKRTYINAG